MAINFGQIYLNNPEVVQENGEKKSLFPNMARIRNLTLFTLFNLFIFRLKKKRKNNFAFLRFFLNFFKNIKQKSYSCDLHVDVTRKVYNVDEEGLNEVLVSKDSKRLFLGQVFFCMKVIKFIQKINKILILPKFSIHYDRSKI